MLFKFQKPIYPSLHKNFWAARKCEVRPMILLHGHLQISASNK